MDTLTLTITTIQVGGTVLQYSYFSVISWFPLKIVHLFELKLWKNSGYTRPTLFVGWGEGLDLCELENAPEIQKCSRLLSMIVAYKMTLTITSLQFDTMQLCTPCYSNFSQFLLLSRFSYICPGSCPPPQVSIFVTWLFGVLWQLGGKRKESLQLRLRNLNISIEKVDTKCWFAEMTLVMMSIPLAHVSQCLFTFVLISASRWLSELWLLSRRGATGELEVEFKFQRRSCKLSFVFPPCHQRTRRACTQAISHLLVSFLLCHYSVVPTPSLSSFLSCSSYSTLYSLSESHLPCCSFFFLTPLSLSYLLSTGDFFCYVLLVIERWSFSGGCGY